jgi:hypothetical protein
LANFQNRTKHLKRPNLLIADSDKYSFEFNQIKCGPMKRIYGSRNLFDICIPQKYFQGKAVNYLKKIFLKIFLSFILSAAKGTKCSKQILKRNLENI